MFHLPSFSLFFFFNDTATTEIYTLSLHDALPISALGQLGLRSAVAEVPHLERQDLAGLAANLGLGHEAKAHGRSPPPRRAATWRSSSSSVRGQSCLSRRESPRSASSRSPVWQRGQ